MSSITMELIPGTTADMDNMIKQLEIAIDLNKYNVIRDTDYLIMTEIQKLHKQYNESTSATTWLSFSMKKELFKAKMERFMEIKKKYKGKSKKSDSLLETTERNLRYKLSSLNKYDKMSTRSNNKIICIMGESGSGKSTIESKLVEKYGFYNLVSDTTRNPRENEVDGVHYNFMDIAGYTELKSNGEYIETASYPAGAAIGGLVHYGLRESEVESKLAKGHCVFVVTPHGYKEILKKFNHDKDIVKCFYIRTSPTKRLARTIERYGNNADFYLDEMLRRFTADKSVFDRKNLGNAEYLENDYEEGTLDKLCEEILEKIK